MAKGSFIQKFSIIFSIILLSFSGCTNGDVEFEGSRVSNDTQFVLDFSILNTTYIHEMDLFENDTIDVFIDRLSGKLNILVTDQNDESIYRSDNASSVQFALIIVSDGLYRFEISGEKASGYVSFILR